MARNSRQSAAPPDAVWAVLCDGHSYGDWVVGTSGIRSVDATFPQPASRLHYTVGRGPIRHEGHTEVLDVQPGHSIELEANAWPLGAARIVLTLEPRDGGTTITIEETPSRGLGKVLNSPVTEIAIKVRNLETLRRLDRLAARA